MKVKFGNPYKWVILLLLLAFSFQPVVGYAKKKDKVRKRDTIVRAPRSPHKATLWALLPGAGQIYNRKYWKLPIVYAGFAAFGYFAITNRNEYIKYNDAYICSAQEDSDDDFTCEDPLAEKYSTGDLQTIRDYYLRNAELSFILAGLWYVLQILDATVDAHLTHWEVNEDLSVEVQPLFQPIVIPNQLPAYNGLKVAFKF